MAFPVDNTKFNMTGRFGPRKPIKLPGGGKSGAFHYGDDLAPEAKGTQELAYAVGKGVVHSVGRKADAGIFVILRLQDNSLWRYCHLSTYGVRAGQEVSDGQIIGRVGNTGNATGVHLHLERYPDGQLNKRVDPNPYYWAEPNPAKKKGSTPVPTPSPAPAPAKPKPAPPRPKTVGINSVIRLSTEWKAYRYNTLVGPLKNLPAGDYLVKGIVNGNLRLHGNGRQAWVHRSAAAGLQ